MIRLYAVCLKAGDDYYFSTLFARNPDDVLTKVCAEADIEFDRSYKITGFDEFGVFNCPDAIGELALEQIELAGPPRFHKNVDYKKAEICMKEISRRMQNVLYILEQQYRGDT